MESKSSDAKPHKSDIALYRDFVRFKGCCSHSALKDAKRKYWEYRSHSGHLYMLLEEILGLEYVKSHELDESIMEALDKICAYNDLVNVTDEEIRGLKDIVGFAFSHRNGTKWDELTHADNLYHKIKSFYLSRNNIGMPQHEIYKIREMTKELEDSLIKDPFDKLVLKWYVINLPDKVTNGKRIRFTPIRHRDGD
jgi:hypothetical protein